MVLLTSDMGILSGLSDFFGLELSDSVIRAVQIRRSGDVAKLAAFGQAPINSKLLNSDAPADTQQLIKAIQAVISQAGISTRNVALNITSDKSFTTVVDFENLPENELSSALLLQAGDLIPTPIENSKIDWALLGQSPVSNETVEILLTSAANDHIERRLDIFENMGLNVVAFEPDAIAMTRSLTPPNASGAIAVLVMTDDKCDLVITLDGAPRFVRTIQTGLTTMVKAAAQQLRSEEAQTRQFVVKFGVVDGKLEDQIKKALLPSVQIIFDEIEKTFKFFATRYKNAGAIQKIVVAGHFSSVPGLPLLLANTFSVNVELGNAWLNVAYPKESQNDLLSNAAYFSVAAGLGLRVQ